MTSVVLQIAIFVITFILVTLVAVIAVARGFRTKREARYEARVAVLRPVVLRTLSDDEPDTTTLDDFVGVQAKLVEEIAWSLLPKVRGTSRDALVAWLVERGSIEAAQKDTTSWNSLTRARGAQRLGSAGVARAQPDIARLLNDRDQEVRVVAARALGKLGNPDAVPALLGSLEGTRRIPASLVSMAIIHIGPSAVDQLILGLDRWSSWSRTVCADLLGVHGAYQAAPLLARIVEDDMSINVRTSAAAALGRIGAPQAVDALLRATAIRNASPLRVAATRSLGRIGADRVLEPLFELTRDHDVEVAIAATEALSSMGHKGRDLLIELSRDHDAVAARARDWLSRSELATNRVRRHRAVRR